MKFMLLIHTDPAAEAAFNEEERARNMAGHYDLVRLLREQGRMVDGARLYDDQAATVRRAGSEVMRTDGPYAEAKEVAGGYYVVECDGIDEACAYAAMIPTSTYGTIEVRRLYE